MSEKNTNDILHALLDTEITLQKEVYMNRFKVSFKIEAIDGKMINRIREQATFPTKSGRELDEEKFGALIIQKACKVPNWSDPQLIEKFGPTPTDVIQNRLLAGEIAKITTEILELSGFVDEDEKIDEIKN
ncbi:phage tail assembly chaperone [Longirhabdus pacifica]|uniref:phage tail assembly chaperone n=1 Tax=Longirhabdus pacifica TaxID=2305227 RepID=UPI001008AE30|nr:hypothetical protein [Longirhabdus pacifica]